MTNSEPVNESNQGESEVPYWSKRSNIAPIKSEYVIWSKFDKENLRDEDDDRDDELEAEGGNRKKRKPNEISTESETTELKDDSTTITRTEGMPEEKRIKLTRSQKKQRAIEEKKSKKGMNKSRNFSKTNEIVSIQLCSFTSIEKECTRGIHQQEDENSIDPKKEQAQAPQVAKCKFNHDIKLYMKEKSEDIKCLIGQDITKLTNEELQRFLSNESSPNETSLTYQSRCPLYESFGKCSYGYRCKFLLSHLEKVEPGDGYQGTDYKLMINQTKIKELEDQTHQGVEEMNVLPFDLIRKIRKKQYDLPLTKAYLDSIGELLDQRQFDHKGRLMAPKPSNRKPEAKAPITSTHQTEKNDIKIETEVIELKPEIGTEQEPSCNPSIPSIPTESSQDIQKDLPLDRSPLRANEKTRLIWRNKLYLAPLTTVGNLPFRRLCTSLGCEITCGEMALCQDLIGANTNEWTLVKRHPSEKTFGVQVAGSRPQLLVPAAEMIGRELEVDFVDVNCGCPIDLVFKKGSGAALLEHTQKLGKSLIGMSKVLNQIPLTIKLRTGITEGRNVAHKIMPQLQHWGVGATTLHGRSRQQRYSKRADWNYISECVKTLHNSFEEEPDLPPIPIFGNGDCYDYREYYENMEMSGVDGIMIARGALTKPWIFTEIKERRDWDISSRERLDQIGKLASFGLEHWGSDTQGVNTTRRFLCESLGFQYRYVPVGLLERLPARINDRPYPFKGRDELETLLASGSAKDWVKISELFLGPTPNDWNFIPKHKSNAYEEGNG